MIKADQSKKFPIIVVTDVIHHKIGPKWTETDLMTT